MKKITLLIVTAFIIQATASSQSCLPEGIIFTTQVQIDDFQINHPNCTTIEGDVEIIGDDITNLNGLNVLTAIEGGLKIGENDSLTSLTGLDNIASVGGTLRIFMNPALTSLSGLDNVSSIGGNLRITGNDTLGSLIALNNNFRRGKPSYLHECCPDQFIRIGQCNFRRGQPSYYKQ